MSPVGGSTLVEMNMQEVSAVQGSAPLEVPDVAPRLGIVTFETIAYVVLAALSLVLRLAEIDRIPLSDSEAQQALAAWNVLRPEAFGDVATAQSPLMLFLHYVSFTLFGASEFSARILTALVGAGVAFTPLLFRSLLGRSRAFLMSALLVFSPVLLLASRFGSPFVWTLLFAALGVWAARRQRETDRAGYAILAILFFAVMLLLTDPGSLLFTAILLLAWLLAPRMLRLETPDLTDPTEETGIQWRGWNWMRGIALSAFAVFLISTLFMAHPSGLSNVGELLGAGIRNLTALPQLTPPLYVLFVSLFYEPFFWLLGIVGLALAWGRGMSPVDRFFAVWLALGIVASILDAGGSGAHALWLTIPLVGLTARAALEALREDRRLVWNFPVWARWVVAAATVALLAVFSVALQSVARSLMRQNLDLGVAVIQQIDPLGLVVLIAAVLFFVVSLLLAGSIWDMRTALRGALLGTLLFGAFTSLGSGWNAAVPYADSPLEPYHFTTPTQQTRLLRETLIEVAKRESRGFPMMTVAVSAPQDNVLAWLLRDFTGVHPIDAPSEVNGEDVVILPVTDADETLNLGDTYVGQDFTLRRGWRVDYLTPLALLSWWTQREAPTETIPLDSLVLWLRQDVYLGIPPAE